MRFPFNWYNKFGTIPSSYREAMSYEEQILWLCQQVENLKIESGNFNYNMLENKPSINGVTLEGNITATQLGLDNYNYLLNKPAINGVTLLGNKSLSELDIQGKLTAGSGIRIVGNTISATGGGSGGTTDYDELTNKPSINGVVVNGDLDSKTLRLQDSLINDRSLEINNNFGKVAHLANYQVNDIVPKDIPEISYSNASYITFSVAKGTYLDIYGNYDLYKIDGVNKLSLIFTTNGETTGGSLDVTEDGTVVINFFDVGNYNPELKEYMSGELITQDFDNLDKEIKYNSFDLNTFLRQNYDFESLLAEAEEGLFIGMGINDPLPEPLEDSTSRYIKIAKSSNYSCIFNVNGTCNGSYMWFTTEDRAGTEYLVSHSELNLIENGYIGVDIPENADYIYFQFTNFNASTNVLNGLMITEIEGGGGGSPTIAELTSPIILTENQTPTLESGLYLVGAGIYIGSALYTNVVFGAGEIVYYKANSKKFYGDFNIVEQIEGTWSIAQNERIDGTTLSNSRNRIPSSLAVYNALQNVNAIHKIYEDISLITDTVPTLQTGLYVLTNAGIYIGEMTIANLMFGSGEIVYYEAPTKTFYGSCLNVTQVSGEWIFDENDKIDVTTMTNRQNKFPTSLAVYNAIHNKNIMNANNSATFNVNQDSVNLQVPLSENLKIGTAFSIDNSGKITTNRSITVAKISFSVTVLASSTTYWRKLIIKKNSSELFSVFQNMEGGSNNNVSVPNCFTSLSSGDTVSFEIYGKNGDKIDANRLIFSIEDVS